MALLEAPVHAVVAQLAELPAALALIEGPHPLIPLSTTARAWPFVVCYDDQHEQVLAALSKFTVISGFGELPKSVDAALGGEVGALCRAMASLLGAEPKHGLYVTATTYDSMRGCAVVDATPAQVVAQLKAAKLTCATPATLPRLTAENEDAAIERARLAFESFPEKTVTALVAWLKNSEVAVPKKLATAVNDDNDLTGAFAWQGLPPAFEQWNGRIAAKLIDLWLASEGTPTSSSTSVFLASGVDPTPELGLDRAQGLVDLLRERGLSRANAIITALGASRTPSSLVLPTRLLAEPGAFAAMEGTELWAARQLMERALQQLRRSPTVARLVAQALAEHRPSLGVGALSELVHLYADERDCAELIDDRHLELAANGGDLGDLLNFAAKLEKRSKKTHANARAFVTRAWAAQASPEVFNTQMERALDRDLDLTIPDAAWSALADQLESSGPALAEIVEKEPAGNVLYRFRNVKKPSARVAGRVATWLETNKKVLPAIHHAALLKKVGKAPRPKPLPYKASELTKLPRPIADAIAHAREASWKAELKLPKGAAKTAIAAAEKMLGVPLPEELKAFYALHDGAGGDEIFRGQELYSLKRAVGQRKTLASYAAKGGRPIDPAWLPITADGAGNHDCVVLSGKQAGQVVDFDHETGGGRVIAKTLAAYLKAATWGET
ncbi:MAG: SMI1/KNR4 family protein [Myxococcales bacterium]|nr:SMI1/KNR4 family protein [Myxococcales bacterium]MDP3504644.1 SMI1/KNR4 family protein [Myxococcales bacterium]